MDNNIYLSHKFLSAPFKQFNEENGKTLYNSIFTRPAADQMTDENDKDEVQSILILHLAGDTERLIELLESKKNFLLKSGHMSIEDQTMIIEILIEHAFKRDKLYHVNLIKLCSLLNDFLQINYEKLNLVLDWRHFYNTLFSILNDNELKVEMFTLSEKRLNFFNLTEKLFIKLNKFFPQGSGTEIFTALKPFLFFGNSKFSAACFCFSVLIPTKRFNTDEDEIQEWLPFIIDLWRTVPYSKFYRGMFIRLMANVTQNFCQIDFKDYNQWIAFQLNLVITRSNEPNHPMMHGEAHCEKYFAEYYINTFKSTEVLKLEQEMIDEAYRSNLDEIVTLYRDYIHPSNKFNNKASVIHFLKHLSMSLCHRVRYEKTRLADNPDCKFKLHFFTQEDIVRLIRTIKPLLETALQGEVLLEQVSFCLKNLVTLDCDEILSMFLFTNFAELEQLANNRFITILNELIIGVLVNTQNTSQNKYDFIQRVIEYLISQAQSMDVSIMKGIMNIFNAIWSVLPVVNKDWSKGVVESVSKSGDYNKYMKTIKKNRIQEYQFYKLYEKIQDYAIEYFNILKSYMNLGIQLKDEIIRAFWFLLNSMQTDVYTPLIQDLIDTANQEHSKVIIGGVLGNIAARDSEQACKITKYVLNKLIDSDDGKVQLNYSNFSITEFYLIILNSVIYQSSEAASKNTDKLFELVKLLIGESDKDKSRGYASLIKAILKSYSEFSVNYSGLLLESSTKEFCSKLWINNCLFDQSTFEPKIKLISTEEFNSLHSFISTKFIPWINELLTKSSDKNTIKIASYLIKEVEESLSSLLPSKNGSKIANFTEFYYKHIDLSQELIDGLQELEKQIFEVIESINEKVQAEEGLRRDPEIIKNIGVVYKQISTSNSMSVKGISFNENKHIFSPLEYKEQKRLETHYLIEVGAITKLLLNLNKANYKKEDAFMSKALERVYKYEEYIAMIPSVQNDVKMLSKPEFIQYFDEYEQTHISKLDSLYLKILQQIKDINSQTEIEVVLRDELVGNIVLFERMANSEVLKKKEQILKILLLVFYGSSVKDEKVTKHVWNVCIRAISSASRWRTIKPQFEASNDDFFWTSSTFAKLNKAKSDLSSEISTIQQKLVQSQNDRRTIARGIIDSVINFSEDLETKNLIQQDIRILGSIDIWLCYFEDDLEYLLKISNFLIERLFVVHTSVRMKSISLLRKILNIRIKLNRIESEEIKVEAEPQFELKGFNRLLPDEPRPFLDSLSQGWNTPISSYKVYKGDIPFSKCTSDVQERDRLFKELVDEEQRFIHFLFISILTELNSKQDIKISQGGGINLDRLSLLQLFLKHKKNKDPSTFSRPNLADHVMTKANLTRYFGIFYNIFKYYGVDVYKANFMPVIQSFITKGFKEIEHPNVCKAFIADVICAFMRTSKYYYEGNEAIYYENLELLFEMFGESEQIDQNVFFRDSFMDAFSDRDPKRFDGFLTKLINEISLGSTLKSRNILGFLRYLSESFHWKFSNYLSEIINKILKADTKEITPPKNISEVIKPSQNIIMSKNWSLISKFFAHYIALKHKVCPNSHNDTFNSICDFFRNILSDLKIQEESEDGLLLINNCITNLVDFFKDVLMYQNMDTLPDDLILIAFDISFLCIEKSVQKQTIDSSTKLIESIISKVNSYSEDCSNVSSKESCLKIMNYLFSFKENSNWRVREHILFILQGINSILIRRFCLYDLSIDEIIPFFLDDNVYVTKMARLCLKTALQVDEVKLAKITEKYIKLVPEEAKNIKALKSKNEDVKEATSKLNSYINILLSCCYACGYSIPEFLPKICMLIYRNPSDLKTDVYEFISGFKNIHNLLIKSQGKRFSEEQYETLNDILNINTTQSVAY